MITGGAGFIGTNLAHRLLRAGRQVRIYDNLSRSGAQQNLRWLRAVHGSRLQFHRGDVRNAADIRTVLADIGTVFHLAAQVAVTTSLADPREDFYSKRRRHSKPSRGNSAGRSSDRPRLYLDEQGLRCTRRHSPHCLVSPLRSGFRDLCAIDETRPLSFHSPYGCSKGTADQYVLDYARGYSVHAAVFRMSCIYGPHQYGTEDQGWVAHFLIQALQDMPITIYGDGKQVRDLLYIDDLIDALLCAEDHLPQIAGQAFNIGGGPDNTMSLIELIERITALNGSPPVVAYGPWRVGDQRWYVSNPDKFERATGWRPKITVENGLRPVIRVALGQSPDGPGGADGWNVKVALVNPNWSFGGSIYFGCREPHLPLEYGYAKALLTRSGHTAEIFDAQAEGIDETAVAARVGGFAPDMTVVTTAPSYLFWRCAPPELRVPQEILAVLASASGIKVAVGPHGSTTPRAALRKLGVDAVVLGECEETLVRLADLPRDAWGAIAGLCYLDNGDVVVQGRPSSCRYDEFTGTRLASRNHRRTSAPSPSLRHGADRSVAPKWRCPAAVPITALSVQKKISATNIAVGHWRRY